MLNKSTNGQQWVDTTIPKLKSFLDRAPVITSMVTSSNGEGVFIIINDKKQKNYFKYDFEKDPKVWIHDVKDWIVSYYPRLVETITAPHILTADEKALILEQTGGSVDSLPEVEDRVVQINSWRIDKFIRFRHIFLLLKEGEIVDGKYVPSEKPIMRRFKYMADDILFLRHYREGTYKDLTEISKEFFENAIPLDDVEVKNE